MAYFHILNNFKFDPDNIQLLTNHFIKAANLITNTTFSLLDKFYDHQFFNPNFQGVKELLIYTAKVTSCHKDIVAMDKEMWPNIDFIKLYVRFKPPI